MKASGIGRALAVLLTGLAVFTVAASAGRVTFRGSGVVSAGVAPVAVLAATRRDLGVVREGSTVEVRFPVRNDGGRRLILREANGGCECMVAAQPEIVVEPGETRELVGRLSTTGARGPLELGLRYATNDPYQRLLELTVLVDVTAP